MGTRKSEPVKVDIDLNEESHDKLCDTCDELTKWKAAERSRFGVFDIYVFERSFVRY